MEKARNRFANLQDELRRVHPSDERKYKVNFEETIFGELDMRSSYFTLNLSPYQLPQLLYSPRNLIRGTGSAIFAATTNIFFLLLQEIQNQIIQEYKENNNNSSFQDKKHRYDCNFLQVHALATDKRRI